MKRFALIGAAGYVAPRHLKAIKQTGNNLVAAYDPHDSVGILDSFFPKADFFTNYERFERFIHKQNYSTDSKLDYITVCSPNYLHDTHIRLGLQNGCDVVCEKPLVLTAKNLDILQKLEVTTGKKVFTIMQLRYHPSLIELKSKLNKTSGIKFSVALKYITPRGNWYHNSWKGEESKSGGIATNIGIHLFDLLIWLFGNVNDYQVEISDENKIKGKLNLQNAEVDWFLSIDGRDLPETAVKNNKVSYRSLLIDGEEIEFSDGFTDLHTKVYEEIFDGRGLGIEDARSSIELVEKMRKSI
jgi:UDP-N-acetyl-2-amino-2-deoxyglucuronate dehydrogenase